MICHVQTSHKELNPDFSERPERMQLLYAYIFGHSTPEVTPIGCSAAPDRASAGTFGALRFATDVAQQRAQKLRVRPAASPNVRHRGSPSCVLAARHWTGPAPNTMFETCALPLLASRISPSNISPWRVAGKAVYRALPTGECKGTVLGL